MTQPPPADWSVWALPLGAGLDAIVGDPRGWPHPVRGIGWLIARGERLARVLLARTSPTRLAARLVGVALAVGVVAVAAAAAWLVATIGDRLGGPWPLVARTLLVYYGLAARSLAVEALRAAEAPDLATARRELAMIVGRDTDRLDRPEIGRACLETIGENAADGVVAPLFWYALGGPAGLWAFKAISTLDSMVGYRDERYRDLGWASARLDDLANLVPARLTWLLLAASAALAGEDGRAALRIGWRDGRNHPSPNSAWGEAATAGALGVQLGGPATYRGVPSSKPLLGDPGAAIGPQTVRRAVRLLAVATALGVAAATLARYLLSA